MIKVINTDETIIGYDFYADVAERIVSERKKHGMTQSQLAKAAAVPASLLSRYESVAVRMRKPILEKIAKTLNITFDTLIGAEYDDADAGICLYTVKRRGLEGLELFFDAKSPQEAFLKAYEWSREAGLIWFECRDRAVVTLRGIPLRKIHYSNLRKRDSEEDKISPDYI